LFFPPHDRLLIRVLKSATWHLSSLDVFHQFGRVFSHYNFK
jgi:hypothetical protein